MNPSIRDLQLPDIPILSNYWSSLTPADLTRMSIIAEKLPTPAEFQARLAKLIPIPLIERQADPLIWLIDNKPVGFTNLNNIQRPGQGDIHLHMIDAGMRGKGYGQKLFMMSVNEYFKRHGLRKIICQPSAKNPAPNKLMAALKMPILKTYTTIPSVLTFEHEVNRYEFQPSNAQSPKGA
jgi:RimJ/RimL family protein N-acetyltransferase